MSEPVRRAAVRLVGVDKSFGHRHVLRGVTCELGEGVHVVSGASGAGKTTLLRLVMGLETPDAGTVEVAGPKGSPRLAATFQEDRLCEGLTATANIRLVHGRLRGEALEAFLDHERQALAAVGLPDVEGRPVRELSGGQRRRVALLRAVLADADVVLLDEPLKGLDERTAGQVLAFLDARLAGRCVMWVTHSVRETRALAPASAWEIQDGRLLAREVG